MKISTFLLIYFISLSASSKPDCSENEDFVSSTYGMLRAELLPLDIDFPESDASKRAELGDYRLLAFGTYSGITTPFEELLDKNEICQYGIRVISGLTDAYESKEHRVLAETIKQYIRIYNKSLVTHIKNTNSKK
jgi:hypothetical protein